MKTLKQLYLEAQKIKKKKKVPKWKKKGLVGPGGAAKTAERQAAKQGKKNNKAYKAAIYAKMTGK